MIKIIEGTDWSSTKNGNLNVRFYEDLENDVQVGHFNEKEEKIILNPYDYFEHYKSLYGNSNNISPINLGIYRDTVDDAFYSTQFVGIMPLVDLKTLKPYYNNDNELCCVKIDSRFHISPSEMLRYVLDGDDYYENPDMLQCNVYSISEVKALFGKGKKNKVLCGIIKNIGKITLENTTLSDSNTNASLNPLLSSVYPIFEIIRFINLAKELCKKNLKQQSIAKEENMVGKVKGRILINKQLKNNISRGQYHKAYCSYNALSENIKENIIIKYALHLCSKFSIADSLHEDIMFCNRALTGVPLKKCSTSDFIGLKNNGAFRQYKQVLDAAKVIINRYYISYENQSSMDEGDEKHQIKITDYSVQPYFIDMNLLFEYYCRALFRKAVNKYNSETILKTKENILELEPAVRGNINLFCDDSSVKKYYMNTYIPDVVVRYKKKIDTEKSKILAVIDAKYSDVEHSGEKRARTHQILFYMNVLNCVNGGLISPSTTKNSNDEKGVLSSKYLYDGDKESAQNLFYIPLKSNVYNGSEGYCEIIKEYLETILGNQKEVDKKEDEENI